MYLICCNPIHSVVVKRAPVLEPEYLGLNLDFIITYHPCDLGRVTFAFCGWVSTSVKLVQRKLIYLKHSEE